MTSPDLFGDTPVAVQAGAHVLLALQGQLASDARAWDNDRGQVQLEVVLQQRIDGHPHAVPIVAVYQYTGPSAAECLRQAHEKAATLKRGTPTTVIGLDLQPGHHRQQPVLKLLHTFAISRTDTLPGPALQPPAHLSNPPRSQEVPRHAH